MNRILLGIGVVLTAFLSVTLKAQELPELPTPAHTSDASASLTWEHNQFQFSLPSLQMGRVSSDAFLGEITLCYFWSEWNRTSVQQLQKLNDFWLKYHLLGVQLVGFCVDSTPDSAQSLFQRSNWRFACARVFSQQLLYSRSPVKTLPTLIVLSPGGVIFRKYEGFLSTDVLETDVILLLRQKP